jgi:hypothetical protein
MLQFIYFLVMLEEILQHLSTRYESIWKYGGKAQPVLMSQLSRAKSSGLL